MKLHILFTTVGLVFFVWISSGQSSESGQVQLNSIKADFIQEKHLKILIHPIISTGTLIFQRPQSLRWEYRRPIPSILLMHGGKVRKFVEKDGQVVEDKGMQLGSMQVVLTEISNWLDGRFTDNDMFSVSQSADRKILLTPKNQALAGLISKIELQLAEQQGHLESVTIYEGPGSFTKMTFSNRVLNQEIPVSIFTAK